ncbi:MAG TPA: carboxypeptidase-like regulatory domain-containing protein [Thermoanaerobaculia bacterium]|jgi:hypothetical protein
MRTFVFFAFLLLLAQTAAASTLTVEVDRNGFAGPVTIAVAPRVDGQPPRWTTEKRLPVDQSTVSFNGLTEGLYTILASGPQPLQRLSAKANLDSDGTTLRLAIPRRTTSVHATLAGQPVARARIGFTHDALRWRTELEADDDGRFAGDLWEPAVYTVSVHRDRTSAPHSIQTALSEKPLAVDVPDRHVSGRILADGKPLAGATVMLRSEQTDSTLNVRTQSAADGRFEFFGVREGALSLVARAPSYLDSDAMTFELRGASGRRTIDVELTRGEPRAIRVVDAHDAPIAGATLMTACDGHLKSTMVTGADGSAKVAVPRGGSCAVYVLPKEGSIAVQQVSNAERLVIRVPEPSSSLQLAVKSVADEPFPDLILLMRIDGAVVPPAIARLLGNRGFRLMTNDQGSVSLPRIPAGTYEFWPYRTSAEGQMLYESAMEFAAPISLTVKPGENNATVRLKTR